MEEEACRLDGASHRAEFVPDGVSDHYFNFTFI
jgi:hypothetical protein